MRRAFSHPRPANPPDKRTSVRARFDDVLGFTQTAITSRACALGAAPCKVLRYAPTARCARLARVGVASSMTVAVSERETLMAPLSERVTLAIA
jgi:hypothetical protein